MKRRALLAAALVVAPAVAACVDLFHDTDFATLCDVSPDDPACGADAGSADTGPPDAPAPAMDFCALTSQQARDAALKACAWLGACTGFLGDTTFGACAVQAQLAMDCRANPSLRPSGSAATLWSCLATATSCDAIEACLHGPSAPACAAIGEGRFTACGPAGDVRVECVAPGGGPPSSVEPCQIYGKRCAARDETISTCTGGLGYGTCTTSGCSGTHAVGCSIGGAATVDNGVDCALVGAGRCIDADGGPTCAGEAPPPCDTFERPAACLDGGVSRCLAGRELRVDCAALGLPCHLDPPRPTWDLSSACDARGGHETCVGDDECNGSELRSCGRGVPHVVDCTKAGLGPCVYYATGRASCSLP